LKTLNLLALVPHRDACLPLRAWSAALFAAGCDGAWSFPWAAPLAVVSCPLRAEELQALARALREQSLAGERTGKFSGGQAARAALGGCFDTAALFGPVLDFDLPNSFFDSVPAEKIISRFSPPVLGAALLRDGDPVSGLPPAPAVSFRAAALANLACRPLAAARGGAGAAYSVEWRIGALRWLPAVKKTDSKNRAQGR
jgi:hypothetical protein